MLIFSWNQLNLTILIDSYQQISQLPQVKLPLSASSFTVACSSHFHFCFYLIMRRAMLPFNYFQKSKHLDLATTKYFAETCSDSPFGSAAKLATDPLNY
jgi:hypothetical protein